MSEVTEVKAVVGAAVQVDRGQPRCATAGSRGGQVEALPSPAVTVTSLRWPQVTSLTSANPICPHT